MEWRARQLRRLFSLTAPRRRELVTLAIALALLPCLAGIAAAQPIVIKRQAVSERVDSQVFLVFDNSLSMSARSAGPGSPTRLDRAKSEARQLIPRLGDIPVGIATMTDRVLPNVMPTTDTALALRVLQQSVAVDQPPPSQFYAGRATTFQALFAISANHFFAANVRHPILVVFTDGEANPLPPSIARALPLEMPVPPLFVHVWSPSDRIYVRGKVLPKYSPDPRSAALLDQFALATHGEVLPAGDLGALLHAIRSQAGSRPATTLVIGYTRVALAPWFLLAGVFPLGFLFWKRNL